MQEVKVEQFKYVMKIKTFSTTHTIQAKTATECYTPLFFTPLKTIQNNNGILPDFSNIGLVNINIKNLLKSKIVTNSVLTI